MRTIDDMIRQEVHYCVSGFVSTLARQGGWQGFDKRATDLAQLCEQAAELAAPVDDYEEAAVQEHFVVEEDDDLFQWRHESDDTKCGGGFMNRDEAWRACCNDNNLDPYQREVFEHWLVSNWFAEKLTQHGEKVDTDFAGMTVWARTTTGQAISQDGVVQRIYREVMK